MKYRKKYEEMTKLVDETFGKFGWNGAPFTDECVDAENCGHINDGSEEFYAAMIRSFHSSVGQRLADAGLDPSKVGISY
jgi:hypothetical protein